MKYSATTINLMINPPVSQKTGKNTTSGCCGICKSFLDIWPHHDCSTMFQGGSGNSSGTLKKKKKGTLNRFLCVISVAGKHFICVFRLWGEPVNLREQHDALEFFNSLVDSLDEALKALGHPAMLSKVLGGSFADQKICQGCPHR